MRKLALLVVCVAVPALSGCISEARAETWIGTTKVTDGGTISNRTTDYANAVYTAPAAVFAVPPSSKISVQCDQDSDVCTMRAGCDAGTGTFVWATQLFPTSTGPNTTLTGYANNPDASVAARSYAVTYNGGWVSNSPHNFDGGVTSVCHWSTRNGNE